MTVKAAKRVIKNFSEQWELELFQGIFRGIKFEVFQVIANGKLLIHTQKSQNSPQEMNEQNRKITQ